MTNPSSPNRSRFRSDRAFGTTCLPAQGYALLCACLLCPPAVAQTQPGVPLLDNQFVDVRDVKLEPGKPVALGDPKLDSVILYVTDAEILTTDSAGHAQLISRKFGDAAFEPRGVVEREKLTSGQARLIVVHLKDVSAPVFKNKLGYPPAFPRPGSTKVLESDRVTVWNYTYALGVPTPMHYHDKDTLVVYRYDGTIQSTTPDGKSTLADDRAGTIRFSLGDRTHVEQLVKGRESILVVELK